MLRWLPVSGDATWQHFILPAVALGYYATPAIMRLTRSGMMETLQSDHVRTARAFGLSPWSVVIRHGLRHAIIPVVSLAAVQLGFMLGGSIVIETVFSLRGVGYLAWQSIQRADIEVIQAILLIVAATYALLTLLADILNAALDPRIRVG
jgi:peptide/nickel transport system permease protein